MLSKEGRLDLIKRAHAERNGGDGAASPPAPAGPDADLSPQQRRILEAARAIAEPGEPVSRSAIAERTGIDPQRVSVAVSVLRGLDRWPFARGPSHAGGRPRKSPRPPAAPAGAAPPADPAPRGDTAPAVESGDAELAAIAGVLSILRALPADAARRVTAYLSSRLEGGAPC